MKMVVVTSAGIANFPSAVHHTRRKKRKKERIYPHLTPRMSRSYDLVTKYFKGSFLMYPKQKPNELNMIQMTKQSNGENLQLMKLIYVHVLSFSKDVLNKHIFI